MNKKKLVSVTLIALTSLFLMAGCQTDNRAVGEPPVPMKTVTQNSKEDLATFEFQVPEGWASAPKELLTVFGYPESAAQTNFKTEEDAFSFMVGIRNYYYPALALSEEDKQMYKDLFAGKPDAFEERMNSSLASETEIDAPSSILGWFDLLLPKEDDAGQSSGAANKPEMDFQYQHYNGTNGKITEVQYSYTYNGKEVHMIECYREDIPYLITGAFDESVDLSSGQIALWVADSLRVTEHFTVKDNAIQKED